MSQYRRVKVIATIGNYGTLVFVTAKLDKRGDCKGFEEPDRRLMDRLISSLSNLFEVCCLWSCMSKRLFEMLLFIPRGRISEAEATLRSMAYYADKPNKNLFSAEDLSDLSCYMHYLLRVFSLKWGQAHGFLKNRGKVWSDDHFDSKILDEGMIGRIFNKEDTKSIIAKLKEKKVDVPLKIYTGPVYLGANTCGSLEFVHTYAWDGRRRGCVRIDRPRSASWGNRSEEGCCEYDKPSWYVTDIDMAWENLTSYPSCRGAGEIKVLSIPLVFGLYFADGCYRWWKRRQYKARKAVEMSQQ